MVARVFIFWVETGFYDFVERFAHTDIMDIVEKAHLSILSDLHSWNLRQTMSQLQQHWERGELGGPVVKRPKSDIAMPRPARLHPIRSHYAAIGGDELQHGASTSSCTDP